MEPLLGNRFENGTFAACSETDGPRCGLEVSLSDASSHGSYAADMRQICSRSYRSSGSASRSLKFERPWSSTSLEPDKSILIEELEFEAMVNLGLSIPSFFEAMVNLGLFIPSSPESRSIGIRKANCVPETADALSIRPRRASWRAWPGKLRNTLLF